MPELTEACALLRQRLLAKQEQDHVRPFCAMALRLAATGKSPVRLTV